MEDASGDKSLVQIPRRFVSAQRRFDNARVRDSEITRRLCYDCGEVVCGGEREYQEHILFHEAVYLTYQLHHFEAGQPATATAGLTAAPPPPIRRSHSKQQESRRRHTSNSKSGPPPPALAEAMTSDAAVPVDCMDVPLVADKALMSDSSSFSTTPTYASSQLSPLIAYGQPPHSTGSIARSDAMKRVGVSSHYMPLTVSTIVEEAPKSIAARINEAEVEMDYMLE